MKKAIVIAMVLVMSLMLAACNNTTPTPAATPAPVVEATPAAEVPAAPVETPAAEPPAAPEAAPEATTAP